MPKDLIEALLRPEIHEIGAYHVPQISGIEVKLDANESPYALDDARKEALAAHLAQVPLHRYPDPEIGRLRAILAAENGVSSESLLFGNGSDEIIQILITCLSRPRPGQERASILSPSPTFSVFELFARTHGLAVHTVPLTEDFALDVAATEEAIAREQPSIVFFARPNNPTGTLWPGEALLHMARRFPRTLIVSDEAYGEYATGSLVAEQAGCANLLVMKTLSKVGLAGLRVGYAIAAPALIAELNKARAPYNLSALNQAAAVWMLENCREQMREHCREVVQERARLSALLRRDARFQVFESEANLILFRVGRAGEGGGPALWKSLCERGILLRSFGSSGPLADCLRVTIGTPQENRLFAEALGAE